MGGIRDITIVCADLGEIPKHLFCICLEICVPISLGIWLPNAPYKFIGNDILAILLSLEFSQFCRDLFP